MPDPRAILIAAGVGFGIAGFTILWWHWPLAIGGGAGILLAGLALTGATSVRSEGEVADAAWRAAAPDLQEPPAGPAPSVAVARVGAADLDATGTGAPADAAAVTAGLGVARSRDVPSGD